MKRNFIMLLFAVFILNKSFSQNTFNAILKDSITQEVLIGATAVVKGTTNGASANTNGEVIISNIPDGEQTIVFSSVGYNKTEQTFTFPLSSNSPLIILLSQNADELEEIIIEATRGNKTIDNIPPVLKC